MSYDVLAIYDEKAKTDAQYAAIQFAPGLANALAAERTAREKAEAERDELLGLLADAVRLIKTWHNWDPDGRLTHDQREEMWLDYYEAAPEMKAIHDALHVTGESYTPTQENSDE